MRSPDSLLQLHVVMLSPCSFPACITTPLRLSSSFFLCLFDAYSVIICTIITNFITTISFTASIVGQCSLLVTFVCSINSTSALFWFTTLIICWFVFFLGFVLHFLCMTLCFLNGFTILFVLIERLQHGLKAARGEHDLSESRYILFIFSH